MQRVAIIGGGISGLSAAYYLKKADPRIAITLFEGGKIGGWIQTTEAQGFIMEDGPRSFRVGSRSVPLLRICEDIGILDKVICSNTSSHQAKVWSNEKLNVIMPAAPFRMLKTLILYPKYRRFIIKNWRNRVGRVRDVPDDYDVSIEQFMINEFEFANEEDKDFLIYTLTDAFIQGVYSGDINKLSARFCLPFSAVFSQRYFKETSAEDTGVSTDELKLLLEKAKTQGSSAMNFTGGMKLLPNTLLSFLSKHPTFKLIPHKVLSISATHSKPTINIAGQSHEFDHIISTVPSKILANIIGENHTELAEISRSIIHNSLKAVSLGFKQVKVEGVGYLVPTKEKCKISGALFESCSFPYLKNLVSLMGPVESKTEEMVETFRKQMGVNDEIVYMNVNECIDALPQYHVGHCKVLEKIKKISPDWLSVSGQSFYLSGIPNCVNRSRDLVDELIAKYKS